MAAAAVVAAMIAVNVASARALNGVIGLSVAHAKIVRPANVMAAPPSVVSARMVTARRVMPMRSKWMAKLLPPKLPLATVVETTASAVNVLNVAGVIVNRVESVRRATTIRRAMRLRCSTWSHRLTEKRRKLRRVAMKMRTVRRSSATTKIAATAAAAVAVVVVAAAARTAMARQ